MNDCLYCEVPTENKFSPITFICQNCVTEKEIPKEQMKTFYQERQTENHRNSFCVGCSKPLCSFVVPIHSLGEFNYCNKCVKKKRCKCIMCITKETVLIDCQVHKKKIQVLLKKMSKNQSFTRKTLYQHLHDPVDNFCCRDLSKRENQILSKLMNTKESHIMLHTGLAYVNARELNNLFGFDPERSTFGAKHNQLVIQHIVYYVGILIEESDCFIFVHHNEEEDVSLENALTAYFNEIFLIYQKHWNKTKEKSAIFMKKEAYFLIQSKSTKLWTVASLLFDSKADDWKLSFVDMSGRGGKTVIDSLEHSLQMEWSKLYNDETTLSLTLVDMTVINNDEECWPHTSDSLHDAKEDNLYPLLLLRDLVWKQVSDLSSTNNGKLNLYYILSSLHGMTVYADM